MNNVAYEWVDHEAALPEIATKIAAADQIALDTEFIKIDTFYPKLGVLQINADGQVYLLDGLMDLTPIWQVICEHRCVIMHACGEDVDLIYHYAQCGPLNNIFDTQIALAYLGYGRQLSYQAALTLLLNIQIDKGETRSNWLARPLTQKQMEYAALDVAYLLDLAARLMQELNDCGRLKAVKEDCAFYAFDLLPPDDVDQVYQEIATYRHTSRQLMQLQRLYAWRERTCRANNKPRSFILRGRDIQALVAKPPDNLWKLSNWYDIPAKTVRHYGAAILDMLHDLPASEEWPQRLAPPVALPANLKQDVDAALQALAYDMRLSVDLVMRKKWVSTWLQDSWCYRQHQNFEDLVAYRTYLKARCRYWGGWRFSHVIVKLLPILDAAYHQSLSQ